MKKMGKKAKNRLFFLMVFVLTLVFVGIMTVTVKASDDINGWMAENDSYDTPTPDPTATPEPIIYYDLIYKVGTADATAGRATVTTDDMAKAGEYTVTATTQEKFVTGAEAGNNPTSAEDGSNISLKYPTKKYHSFDGWYTSKDYDLKSYVGKNSGTINSDKTFYGRWVTNSITYELDEGTNDEANPSFYESNTGVPELLPATKNGCEFIGWFADPEFTTYVAGIAADSHGPIVLYAKFATDEFPIEYKLDGGKNDKKNPASYVYGVGVKKFYPAKKKYYNFKGWYDKKKKGKKITSISPRYIGPLKLYARYTPKTYKIDYKLDGGKNSDKNPKEYTYGTGVNKFYEATKKHYTFKGWYTKKCGGKKVKKIKKTDHGRIKLYAHYKKEKRK